MKKQFFLFMMVLLPMAVSADDSGTCGENVTWTWVESTHTLTISGSGDIENYGYFPADDVGYSYDTPWSNYNVMIQTIIINPGVTRIGAAAFSKCTNLTNVTFPSSVKHISACAFSGCSSLNSINLPNGLESIEFSAFSGCNSLSSITIPSSVTYIGVTKYYNAFSGCDGLVSIVVESGNTEYDSRNNCNAIIEKSTNTLIVGCKNTIIPNMVTSIGVCAFEGRASLTSLTIPNGMVSIGRNAFLDCIGLSSITIPNTVTLIDEYAFNSCI